MKYLFLFSISFIISLIITPLIRKLAIKVDAIDKFDTRKIHGKRVITRLGGIAIFLSFFTTFPFLYFLNPEIFFNVLNILKNIFPAAVLILILGIYDDIKGADAKTKFTVQIIAALIVVFSGIRINLITNPFDFGKSIDIGILSIPITVFWIIFITNAINLLDGLDGLAAGISCIISLVMFFIALYQHNNSIIAISIVLTGATAGFLRYNFNPAKIFMGDTGSLFLGFMLACISIKGSHKSAATVAFLIPVVAMGLPIIDTLLAITRRLTKGKNIFKADKEHIHHKLIDKGIPHKKAVLILYSISVMLGIIAFFLSLIKDEFVATILLAIAVIVFIGINILRNLTPKNTS